MAIGRRDFISALGGAAIAWPLAARAQQGDRMRLVAVLESSGSADDPSVAAFQRRLAELGWQEGGNLQLEIRRGEGDINRARTFAAELVAMKPDVFFATNTQMVQLILAKTLDIPIVFGQVPDPIGSGLIASFAQPGGNVTGFTNFEPSVAGKWLEFLKDVVPDLKRGEHSAGPALWVSCGFPIGYKGERGPACRRGAMRGFSDRQRTTLKRQTSVPNSSSQDPTNFRGVRQV